ncbi:unnamed protein product [Sympodiomycopsis kandeliae]
MTGVQEPEYSERWDDPLPHTYSPVKHYLSWPNEQRTKAAIIFMHGRGDNADDMVATFLPSLSQRFGGKASQVDKDNDQHEDLGPVAVVGIEAMDNVWYPNSHNATEKVFTDDSEPYQYSALHKIRTVISQLNQDCKIPLDNIIFAGFSQGAILIDTYLLAGMKQQSSNSKFDKSEFIPLPGYILSLSGSLFKTPPKFPLRGYISQEHKKEITDIRIRENLHGPQLPRQPEQVVARLLCGTADRHFPQSEIENAAETLQIAAKQLTASAKNSPQVKISLRFEDGKGHVITPSMVAAVVDSVDQVLSPAQT